MTQVKSFVLLGALALLVLLPNGASAQSKKKKKSKKEEIEFKERLWYGGGINLGGGFLGGGSSAFGFGISPMVGYKIWGPFSAGPRAAFNFTSFKVPGAPALNLVDVEFGAFLRIRAIKGLFIQGELSNEWEQEQDPFLPLEKIKYSRFNQYVGGGWNFGGKASQEIGIYYNFAIANDLNTTEAPLQYRFMFTYNFYF